MRHGRRTAPRLDQTSTVGKNTSNPLPASWSHTSCSQLLRVHSTCHGWVEETRGATGSPARAGEASAARSTAGVKRFSPFLRVLRGQASPPLVQRFTLNRTSHVHSVIESAPGTKLPVGTLGEQAACHTFAGPTSKPRPVASPGNTS